MKQDEPMAYRMPSSGRICSFRRNLLFWFTQQGRHFPWRRANEPTFRMVVVEVLLQRTRAEVVSSRYAEFFRKFPSWHSLSMASVKELEGVLRPLGLWRRRANALVRLAVAISERHGRLPRVRADIEHLPGVGQYIANAIQLVGWRVRAPLLDVNMARVLERYFGPRQLADIRHDPYLQKLAWGVTDWDEALAVNWAILDLGALICRPRRPCCCKCPLHRGCSRRRGISLARDDRLEQSIKIP